MCERDDEASAHAHISRLRERDVSTAVVAFFLSFSSSPAGLLDSWTLILFWTGGKSKRYGDERWQQA